MDKILSICVPSYNIENYIDKCIGSMIDESIMDKLEIIIVNDGSKDLTLTKAIEWKEKFPQSIVVVDKPNGGHGSTINSAINVATGKYFKNIDGDDWVEIKAFIELINKLETVNVDVVFTDFTSVYINSGTQVLESVKRRHDFKENEVFNIDELLDHNSVPAMHTLTYKTDLLKKNNIKLTENCFYVDVQFYAFPMLYVKSAIYLPINVYQYRLEREGQSVSVDGLIKHYDNHLTVLKSIIQFDNTITDEKYKKYLRRIIKILVMAETELLFNKKAYKDNEFYKNAITQLRNILTPNDLLNNLELVKTYRYTIKYGCVLGINTMPILKWGSNLCKKIKNH